MGVLELETIWKTEYRKGSKIQYLYGEYINCKPVYSSYTKYSIARASTSFFLQSWGAYWILFYNIPLVGLMKPET